MSNSATQLQATLHLIGQNLMWGIDCRHFNAAEDIHPAVNANIENGPVPMMAQRREKSKPVATADTSAANSNIVNLFVKKS